MQGSASIEALLDRAQTLNMSHMALTEVNGLWGFINFTRLAKQAGIQPFQSLTNEGDVIMAVDDTSVASVEDMVAYFNLKRPGDEVTLLLFRRGTEMNITVTLAAWPDT